MIKENLKKIWFFICTWIATSFAVFYLGIQGIITIGDIPKEYDFLKDIVFMFAATVISIIISYFKFSLDTRKKLEETHAKIEELKQKTHTEMAVLEKLLLFNNPTRDIVTVDDFLITRKERLKDENFESIIKSNSKSIKYSGGHLYQLISDIMGSKDFKNYIVEKKVKIQFLFPDPNNKHVIENLVNNITKENYTDTYIGDIRNSVKKLDKFISDNNIKDQIEYKFYKHVPSFGLQIIDAGDNNRLYVELFTIGIDKEDRYQIKIEEKYSPRKYLDFKEQFEKLWDRSKKKKIKSSVFSKLFAAKNKL